MSAKPRATRCPRCGSFNDQEHQEQGCRMTTRLLHYLREYRIAQGKRWKATLREIWFKGQDEGILRELRNAIGPGENRLEIVEKHLIAMEIHDYPLGRMT